MRKITQHLNDEHMQLYEWSGTRTGIAFNMPAKSRRTHPWHASSAVLAVLTSLLILNGCDKESVAEQASAQAGQALRETKEPPLFDDSTAQPAPTEAAAPAAEELSEQAGEHTVQPGEELPRP
ncbi:hypothetical protein [Thiobacillus sp.]